MSKQLRILDLFCGLGGVARGFHRVLSETGVDYEYYAVDIDKLVLFLHKKLNPRSVVVCRDALSFAADELKRYDFVWASPECRFYSRLNIALKRWVEDETLWHVIELLKRAGVLFVVENVRIPKNRVRLRPSICIDRHCFWSNIPLQRCNYKPRPKPFDRMSLDDWIEYHAIPEHIRNILYSLPYMRARKILRSTLDSTLAYNLAKQVVHYLLRKGGWW